jgi:hypothetical protein
VYILCIRKYALSICAGKLSKEGREKRGDVIEKERKRKDKGEIEVKRVK